MRITINLFFTPGTLTRLIISILHHASCPELKRRAGANFVSKGGIHKTNTIDGFFNLVCRDLEVLPLTRNLFRTHIKLHLDHIFVKDKNFYTQTRIRGRQLLKHITRTKSEVFTFY